MVKSTPKPAKKKTKNTRHGGARANSGRKAKNQTWGNPRNRQKNQTGMETFISSSQRQNPMTSVSSRPSSAAATTSNVAQSSARGNSSTTQTATARTTPTATTSVSSRPSSAAATTSSVAQSSARGNSSTTQTATATATARPTPTATTSVSSRPSSAAAETTSSVAQSSARSNSSTTQTATATATATARPTPTATTRPVFGPPPPPPQEPNPIYNLPNHDADDTIFDDAIHNTGKRISDCAYLMEQRKRIMSDEYTEKAFKNIENNGQCWDLPPTIVKKPQYDLKERWKDFHKLPVFNWFPEAMINKSWRPTCLRCGKKCTKNGKKGIPRLIFGQTHNYWLHAPHRYHCRGCTDAQAHLPRKERIQVSYLSTSQVVLSQIADTHPEVVDAFPCHLSKKNAVDKDLMNLVIYSAVKGVGPYAIAQNMISWHQIEWQKGETGWSRNVIRRLNQPSVNQQTPTVRTEIQKCPEYFSKEMGGCTPSGKYLIEMFCTIIQRLRHYYDAECLKRARKSLILAIDASYKIPKLMLKWGPNDRIYDALHSGTNEYNEIIFQRFSTSDNHLELRANLETLKNLGLKPVIVFSDDPVRDESILKRIFPQLDCGDDEETTPQELVEMKSEKQILYVFKYQDVVDTLSRFRSDIEEALSNPSSLKVKLALDCEWPVDFTGDQSNRKKTAGNINIVQLGSNVTDYTVIVELYNFKNQEQKLKSIGQKFKALFNLGVSCITGCKHKADYSKLATQYPMFDLPQNNRIDGMMECVSTMAINRGLTTRGKARATLQSLCKGQKIHLPKKEYIRIGNVFASTNGALNTEALTYCQNDVEAPLMLHSIYQGFPDLTKRLTGETLSVGDCVDIMPESAKNTQAIAQGVVKQIGGRRSKWGPVHNMSIRKDQVLVEVRKVFDGRGIIHYPSTSTEKCKCRCGNSTHGDINKNCNFYLYSQLGAPKFEVIELKSRLRRTEDTIDYPACIYTQTTDTDVDVEVLHASFGDTNDDDDGKGGVNKDINVDGTDEAAEHNDDDSVVDDEVDDEVDGDDMIPHEVKDIFDDEEDDQGYSDDEDDGLQDDSPTPRQVQKAKDLEFNKILEKLIEEADSLSQAQRETFTPQFDTEQQEDLPSDGIPKRSYEKNVKADTFHCMDRAKVPTHHEFKALFFRSLRAAMFVMCKEDVDDVKEVLASKGESWEEKMAFDFPYIAKRVRRLVPPPTVLYNRLKAVYDFFKDKMDSKLNKVLFNRRARNKFENMLELVKKGYVSDPTNISMYVPKTDSYGRPMVDEDGLVLYRSLRGTSNLESLHQYLTTSFGHTISGPWYADCLMTILRHMYNWRMSRKNRPGFPQIMHYDGMAIDRMNRSYEIIYGEPKYREWESMNENLPTESSAYGIVSIPQSLTSTVKASEEDRVKLSKNNTLKYLSERQNSDLPFLPVRGKNERKLIYKKLKDLTAKNESLTSETLLEKLTSDWNENEVSMSLRIFPKLPIHFAKYIKKWRNNQAKRAAAVASGADRLSQVLERVPETEAIVNFEPVSLNSVSASNSNNPTEAEPANTNIGTENAVVEPPNQGPNNMSNVSQEVQEPMVEEENEPTRKRRRKRCQGFNGKACPQPDTCDGKRVKKNCVLITNGDSSLEVKRSCPQPSLRRCRVCSVLGCPGGRNQSKCTGGTNNT